MAIVQSFRATTIWKAFILNSLASSLIILLAITIKQKFDHYENEEGKKIESYTTWKSIIFTMLFTFVATFSAYMLMYWIFGFGGGMIAS